MTFPRGLLPAGIFTLSRRLFKHTRTLSYCQDNTPELQASKQENGSLPHKNGCRHYVDKSDRSFSAQPLIARIAFALSFDLKMTVAGAFAVPEVVPYK